MTIKRTNDNRATRPFVAVTLTKKTVKLAKTVSKPLAAKVNGYIANARADSTKHAYAADVAHYIANGGAISGKKEL